MWLNKILLFLETLQKPYFRKLVINGFFTTIKIAVVGLLIGLLIGMVFAWILAQLLVGVLGLVAGSDWTNTLLLSLFYRVNPIKWILLAAVQSITAISVV